MLTFLAATQDIVVDGWAISEFETTSLNSSSFCHLAFLESKRSALEEKRSLAVDLQRGRTKIRRLHWRYMHHPAGVDVFLKQVQKAHYLAKQDYGVVSLESEKFYNKKYVKSLNLFSHCFSEFMYFFGAVFFLTGVCILLFKNERNKNRLSDNDDEEEEEEDTAK